MEKIICIFALCALAGVTAQPYLWPLPQSVDVGSNSIILDPTDFNFACAGQSCSKILKDAFDRYQKYIFFANNPAQPSAIVAKDAATLPSLIVVANSMPPLGINVDESYTLTVNSSAAVIIANTEWGALRGLETFSQLVDWDFDSDTYSIDCIPVEIQDFPRFTWRGLLMDTSRHYEPVRQILKALDAMSFSKMNVFHWHISDSETIPYQSLTYPLLSQKGSWVPRAIYTPADVRRVVEHGYARGVRVVPEFDTPGHSSSWGLGYPQLFPNCQYPDVFNPTTNYTMTFMQNFLTEVSKAFKDEAMHMGGDEVGFTCWQQDPTITTWMQQHNIQTYQQLQAYYENNIQRIVDSLGKSPVFWEEVFDNSPPGTLNNNTIVHVWFSDPSKVGEVVQAGYRALYSSSWYLDRQIPDKETFYLFEDTWIDFYIADPVANLTLTPQQLALVLGGEACMWGEQVDQHVFDERVWPRACAIGERLWSAESVNDPNPASNRLGPHRCRLVRRGINASPIYPDYCETGHNM